MIGRRSVWTNEKVQKLMQYFIPAADEVGRLQRCDDPDCKLFRKFSEEGHYGGREIPSSTRQGIYAATPSGEFLGSLNQQEPYAVAEMMKNALKKWKSLSREERLGSTDISSKSDNINRAMEQYPEDGLVLRVFTRDLPREENIRSHRRNEWNQDFAWFRKSEARQFLPENPEKGDVHTIPEPLTMRLVRFHLVDFVLGQTNAFPKEAVENAELKTEVKRVDGSRVHIRIRGSSRTEQTGTWGVCGFDSNPSEQSRGYDGKTLGKAVYDLDRETFESFEMVSAGTRWGGTKHNSRCNDLMENPIGFVLMKAPDDSASNRVPPAKIWKQGYW